MNGQPPESIFDSFALAFLVFGFVFTLTLGVLSWLWDCFMEGRAKRRKG